jgi:hypothetical protein
MDVPELSPRQLAKLFIDGAKDSSKRPVLILGAGASIPSLPSAYDLKVQIGSNAVRQSFGPQSSMTNKDEMELEKSLNVVREMCAQEHITLEVLVSLISFRSGNRLDTDAMWDALCTDCAVNEFSHMISLLVKLGCIERILTSNFDHVLEDACRNVGADYQVVSNVQLEAEELNFYNRDSSMVHICPFHGTTYTDERDEYTGPFTATAAGLAKPFSKRMAEYIEDSLSNQNRPIIVFGYSGSDHFDLNPVLSSFKLEEETKRSHWFWCIHSGNGNYCSQAVRNIFGAPSFDALKQSNALYGADTLSVMKLAYAEVIHELSQTNLPKYEYVPMQSTYDQRLQTWFQGNFKWSRDEANNMILDLQNNLAAAWIVSEHYRLIQLGYDEEYCFRFAGIFDVNTSSREVGHYPHLAVHIQSPTGEISQVEFGNILEAARIYRLEMNDPDQLFPVTCGAMNKFIEQASKCINFSPRKDSESAALNVGLAIAYDYLGLIAGRHVTKALKTIKKMERDEVDQTEIKKQKEILASARERATNGFGKCITYATHAKDEMTTSLDKLIPALTWIQVGLDNMGRFKVPGSDEAIEWLMKAIKGRKQMIENDIQQSVDAGETDLSTSKVVAVDMHYPPLWRRGGELVQQILETQGFNSAPNKLIADLSEERRDLVEYGFRISEDAYEQFRALNKAYNLNFPAIFDVRVLVALANKNITTPKIEVENCRSMLESIPQREFGDSKIKSTATWIDNIEARIEDFIAQFHNQEEKIQTDTQVMSHNDLISVLKKHLERTGQSGIKGFHHMDTNGNRRVGPNEISRELLRAGVNISLPRVREMIEGYARPSGELDVFGYMRMMRCDDVPN